MLHVPHFRHQVTTMKLSLDHTASTLQDDETAEQQMLRNYRFNASLNIKVKEIYVFILLGI